MASGEYCNGQRLHWICALQCNRVAKEWYAEHRVAGEYCNGQRCRNEIGSDTPQEFNHFKLIIIITNTIIIIAIDDASSLSSWPTWLSAKLNKEKYAKDSTNLVFFCPNVANFLPFLRTSHIISTKHRQCHRLSIFHLNYSQIQKLSIFLMLPYHRSNFLVSIYCCLF